MVNLRSNATYKDLTSPEGRVAFQGFIDGARWRRVRDMKALHVLLLPGGDYQSLDLGLVAPDFESLMGLCSAVVLQMEPDSVLPLQPVEEWWKFWTSPIVKAYMGYHCPLYKHSRVFVIVRGGEWK